MSSPAMFRRASRVLVGGVDSPVRAFRAVGGTPRFIRSGRGARLTDADGRTFVDYVLSWGPMILGHAHPKVVAAAMRAAKRGSSFGAPTEGETLLAEAVRRAIPSMELIRFTSSGTEAVMSALRVARAFTGRDLIVKFAGCYHGHADSLLVAAGSGAMTLGSPDSAGVPEAWAKTTISVPFNDPAAFDRAFKRFGKRVAAAIVEPAVGNMGVVMPLPGFLQYLRAITKRHGALLIFDEVMTGFRVDWGGAQTMWGVTPDLTTLGKIVGGGYPLAAYGGRRDIMSQVAPLGPVYQAGTLSGNPVAVAAGLATLEELRRTKPYARLERRTDRLCEAIRSEAVRAGVPVCIQSVGSMLTVFFTSLPLVLNLGAAKSSDTKAYARFFHGLLDAGVYFPPAQFEAAFLSTAHGDKELDLTVRAVRSAFKRCQPET